MFLQVQDEIFKAGYHVDVDTTDRKIQKKVQLISCLALFYLFIYLDSYIQQLLNL